MRRLLFLIACFGMLAFAGAATATVDPVVVKPSSLNGWIVDTTILGNDPVPTDFNGPADTGTGTGSFHFGPIGAPNTAKLEMQPPEVNELVSDFQSFQYMFNITSDIAGEDANHLYANVYVDSSANDIGFFGSDTGSTGFYDCRYSYVPTVSVAGWNTFNFTGATAPNGNNASRHASCTTNLGDMPAGSLIEFFRLSGGDTSASDIGLEAAYDLVSVNFGDTVVYDFEPETACTTVCYVDAVNGNDAFGGDTPASAKKTIQAAIDAVQAGGEVRVLPGNYQEGPNPGTSQTGPSDTFGLVFPAGKDGVSVIGVDATDAPVTDASATLADITTVGDAGFGPDGMFVEANGITIQGLTINSNLDPDTLTQSENKTIEVIGDDFTLQYVKTNVANGGGSVYINDWSLAGDVVKAYHILNNEFTDGTSVDISSGAGSTGPLSGREIKNNHFDLNDNGFNGISFNGSGTAVPWYANTVGGAEISGNSFENSTQYIRSRGTVVDAEFAWGDWFNDNTFDRAVVTGPDPANGDLTADAYDCGFGPGSCPNRIRIGGTVQGEVDRAAANDIVLVKAGTYVENVVVPVAKSGLDFRGANYGVAGTDTRGPESIIDGDETGASFVINADDVTLDGFTVTGGANGLNAGVYTTTSIGGYHIQNNIISGNTIGVYANSGSASWIEDNLFNANNIPGPSGGAGIYSEGTQSLTVDGNTFTGHTENNPALFAATASPAHHDLTFTNNTLDNVLGLYVLAVDGGTFTGNDITATYAEPGGATALAFASGNTDITVSGNTIHDSGRGIRIDNDGYGFPDNANIVVNRNSINGNSEYGLGLNGGYTGTLDAECNWYGDASGPTNAANPSGTGDTVNGDVDFVPWLLSDDLDGDCTPIAVDGAAADANGNEGSLISTSGSFSGSIASISADNAIGTFTPNAGAGTWTWSYTPTDNYTAATINVTATGSNGSTAMDSFSTSASNVNPTATFNAPTDVLYSTGFNISLSSPADAGTSDTFTYKFDCGAGYNSPSGTASRACTAPASPGPITVKGTIIDDDGGSTEYTASVEITQPEATLTPESNDFGDQIVGQASAPFSFTLENTGTADLTVLAVALGGSNPAHFGIDTNGCASAVLAPDDTCDIAVIFQPSSLGSKAATLRVTTDDPDLAISISDLSGDGTNAATPGSIRIVVDSRPNNKLDFAFAGDLGSFILDDDSNATRQRGRTYLNLAPGEYEITQTTDAAAWSLVSIDCTNPAAVDLGTRTVTIDLDSNEDIVCTFVNSRRKPDGLISKNNSSFKGSNTYSTTPIKSQTQKRNNVKKNTIQKFYVRAQNDSQNADVLRIDANETGVATMSISYWVNGVNETAAIVAGTYVTSSLNQNQYVTIEIRVAVGNSANNAARTALVYVSSDSRPAQVDVVRAITKR